MTKQSLSRVAELSRRVSRQPRFDSLPLRRPGPPYNAWGLWGDDDELGRVNLITPETVRRGKEEIRDGIVVNLNMPLNSIPLNPVRQPLQHKIIPKGYANDDNLSFNSQASTQWDGMRHFPYQDYPEPGQHVHYCGMSASDAADISCKRLGIDQYTRKPISSRAHLLDIDRHIKLHNLPPLELFNNTTPIPVSMLEDCARSQGVTFSPGDILVLHTGWTHAWYALSAEERSAMPLRSHRACTGVAQGPDMLRFHWENGFAAVASDTSAYEAWPPHKVVDGERVSSCHEVFLSGWGMPIGETFDLRELAETCERLQRWTFFFTSIALYVPGGIASPANAQAVL